MLNLCLVVIATQFAETKRRETENMAAERRRRRRRRRSSSTQASCSAEDDPPDSCYTEIIKYVAHVARRARRRLIRAIRRPAFVRHIEVAFGLRQRNDPDVDVEVVEDPRMTVEVWWNDPDVDVEVTNRRRNGNRHRRRMKKETFGDELDGAPESRPSPRVMSTGIGSPLAPRASPEPSEVDPISSPRWPRGSLVTPPGSAGGSPPLGTRSWLTPAVIQRCRSAGCVTAERQDSADLDYYNSLRVTHANINKGKMLCFLYRNF